MLFLGISSVVAEVFEGFEVFDGAGVDLSGVSLAEGLSTNSSVARSNRRIASRNAVRSVAHSTGQERGSMD